MKVADFKPSANQVANLATQRRHLVIEITQYGNDRFRITDPPQDLEHHDGSFQRYLEFLGRSAGLAVVSDKSLCYRFVAQ